MQMQPTNHVIRTFSTALIEQPSPKGEKLFTSILLNIEVHDLAKTVVHPDKLTSPVKNNGCRLPYQSSFGCQQGIAQVALFVPLQEVDQWWAEIK
jgi:hypothetical protein